MGELLAWLALWVTHPVPELPPGWASFVDPLDPVAASRLMDDAFRDVPPEFLLDTCIMESGCYATRLQGLHAIDAEAGLPAFAGAVRRGKLDRACPFVADTTDPRQWSTRGAHGLMAAYHVQLLGDCVPPQALDVPLFSALAAGRKARRVCSRLRDRGLRCTRLRLRCAWAQAPLGTRRCGRVIRRWKTRLARYRKARPL